MSVSDDLNPRVIPTAYGKYLAVARPGFPIRIGVIGDTEAAAIEEFRAATEKCLQILSRPVAVGTGDTPA